MAGTIKKHKAWFVPVCMLIALVALLYGWQQIRAQEPMGGPMSAPPTLTPVAPTAAPATSAPPSEPTYLLSAVLPADYQLIKIRNWDKTVTELLRFKYKTRDGRTITVHLPATYKTEKVQLTKVGWGTVFQAFAMDKEAIVDASAASKSDELNQYAGMLSKKLAGYVPENQWIYKVVEASTGTATGPQTTSAQGGGSGMDFEMGGMLSPASAAGEYMRSNLSSTGIQLAPLPPALPGML
jgi:hypothetical protein